MSLPLCSCVLCIIRLSVIYTVQLENQSVSTRVVFHFTICKNIAEIIGLLKIILGPALMSLCLGKFKIVICILSLEGHLYPEACIICILLLYFIYEVLIESQFYSISRYFNRAT